jgi:hypothetical protein
MIERYDFQPFDAWTPLNRTFRLLHVMIHSMGISMCRRMHGPHLTEKAATCHDGNIYVSHEGHSRGHSQGKGSHGDRAPIRQPLRESFQNV